MSYQQRQRFQPPELYSISRGLVTRIEPYGCFIKLQSSPISGLVHISQLHANKITNVTDVVSIDDEVWVKVMDVQVESIEDDSGKTRQRHKVKLSMKYVHQDTGQDLDPENEQLEGDLQRSRGGGGGSRGGSTGDGITGGADSQLGRALASNIGMSTAIDPGSLILKGKNGGAAVSSSFNGYSLVGEDEGEPSPPMVLVENNLVVEPKQQSMVRPMGRGRGTTLPAWMTRSDPEDKLGSMGGIPGNKGPRDEKDSGNRDENHKSRKHDKRHRKDKHHKHSRNSRGRKHHKKHKDRKPKDHRRRGRSRSQSYSSYSESSSVASRSFSRSRSKSLERRSPSRSSRKKKSRKHHRRYRDRSRSRSHTRDVGSPKQSSDFTNAEEARAVMERLERQRGER
ncbi:hypothetical protein ACHAXR_003936 [Thalassiosira sp. AJA248-18]